MRSGGVRVGSLGRGRLPRPFPYIPPHSPYFPCPSPCIGGCISDEHYIPSLLAFHGQDNATTCHVTAGTYVDWQVRAAVAP